MEIVVRDLAALVDRVVLIDEDDYEKVTACKWYISLDGYVISTTQMRIHHIVLGKPKPGFVVDHINHNKLDNRKENLRFASHRLNAQNKPKKENTSSKYIGVCYSISKTKWQSSTLKTHLGFFTDEIEAAKEHDRYIIKYLEGGKTNNLFSDEEIQNIKEYYTFENKTKKELPRGICYKETHKLYFVRLTENGKPIHSSSYKELADAINVLNTELEKRENRKQQKILSVPILRNSDGIAIVKTKKGDEILVDDHVYYKLVHISWTIAKDGYAKNSRINSMHRHVFELYDNELIQSMFIDHINRNKLDNRIENLRQVTPGENNHNMGKNKKCTSKYRGVSFKKEINRWVAGINYNKEPIYLGCYLYEYEAALAYNEKAKELYGSNANLNGIKV